MLTCCLRLHPLQTGESQVFPNTKKPRDQRGFLKDFKPTHDLKAMNLTNTKLTNTSNVCLPQDKINSGKAPHTFPVSLNYSSVDKSNPVYFSHANNWKVKDLNIGQLEQHIAEGRAWMPALIDGGQRRLQVSCNEAHLLAVDVDEGLSIEDALKIPFVQKYCALGIESASSGIVKEGNPDGHDKYRLVFRLPFPLKGWGKGTYQIIRACNEYLATQIQGPNGSVADPACKDASRFFYGAKGKISFLLQYKVQLPESFLNDALDWYEARQAAQARNRAEKVAQFQTQDVSLVLKDAIAGLAVIPPYSPGHGTYDSLRTMIAGVLNDLGDNGRTILLNWDAGRGDWGPGGLERIMDSLENTSGARTASVGSLFHLAKQHGWVRPKGQRPKLSKGQKEQLWLQQCVEVLGLDVDPGERLTRKLIAELHYEQFLLGKSKDSKTGYYDTLPVVPDGERRLYVLDGSKGTGKTSGAIKPAIWAYPKGLVTTPTNVLAAHAAEAIGFKHFKESAHASRFSLCPESLHKVRVADGFYCIVLDECNEDIERIVTGNLGNNPAGCREALEEMLAVAPVVIISSDTVYQATVDVVKRMGEFKDSEVEVIQRKRPNSEMTVRLYTNETMDDPMHHWLAGMEADLGRGQRVLAPCGSQGKARAIRRYLAQELPINSLCIDGKYTPEKIKGQFARNPDGFIEQEQLDLLLYTPVLNSGVSSETNHWQTQYEYVSAQESATAASQRGERWRPVTNGRCTERHVHLNQHGLSRHPDPAMFLPEYWEEILYGGELDGVTAHLAKDWGVRELTAEIQSQQGVEEARFKELATFWAIRAFETYMKAELLTLEWESYGWVVEPGVEQSESAIQKVKTGLHIHRELSTVKASRAKAYAKPVESDGEDSTPRARIEQAKFKMCEMIGHDAGHAYDPLMVEAWSTAPGDSGFEKIRRLVAFRMAVADPSWWDRVNLLHAQALLVRQAFDDARVPKAPVDVRETQIVNLLLKAPLIKDIVANPSLRWDLRDEAVKDCAEYMRDHAIALARVSRHSQLIAGLQFTANTPDVTCVNKALKLLGLEANTKERVSVKGAGRKQVFIYGLQTPDDVIARFAAAISKKEGDAAAQNFLRLQNNQRKLQKKMREVNPDLYRTWVRLTSQDDRVNVRKRGKRSITRKRQQEVCSVTEQITNHIKQGYDSYLSAWGDLVNRLHRQVEELQLGSRDLTPEVLLLQKSTPIISALLGLIGGEGVGHVFSQGTTESRLEALGTLVRQQQAEVKGLCDRVCA